MYTFVKYLSSYASMERSFTLHNIGQLMVQCPIKYGEDEIRQMFLNAGYTNKDKIVPRT